MKNSVGIIVNPESGRDIRRLTTMASTFDNNQKLNMLERLVMGLQSMGVERAYVMPDSFSMGQKTADTLKARGKLEMNISVIDIPLTGKPLDTVRAAEAFGELDVGIIVVMGGDGTNRLVFKSNRATPILPISTGTNNVFPYLIETTTAGIAAGVYIYGYAGDDAIQRRKFLRICRGDFEDIALIDVGIVDELFKGSRAVWDTKRVKEVFSTVARPEFIGLSSIAGYLDIVDFDSPCGAHVILGSKYTVKVPYAPGTVDSIGIDLYERMEPDREYVIDYGDFMLALDGERDIIVKNGDGTKVILGLDGPKVLNVSATLKSAVSRGIFKRG